MKILAAATLIAALAVTPALAQLPNLNLIPELKSKTPEEKEQEAIADKAYRDSLRKIPDAKTGNDPWGSVRGTDAPSRPAAAKPAKTTQSKPRPKPDSAAN
jgi:hypothetical protein